MKYKRNPRIVYGGKLELTIVEVDVEALIPTVTGVSNGEVGISKCKLFNLLFMLAFLKSHIKYK